MPLSIRTVKGIAPIAARGTTTVRLTVSPDVEATNPELRIVTDVRLLSRPDLGYELKPEPVQALIEVTSARALAERDDERVMGMPVFWAQTAEGDLLLAPRFDRTVAIEVEGI
jgi:hypothetical protein